MDKDERAIDTTIKKYPNIFNMQGDPFKMADFKGDLGDLLLDARIEERMKHTAESKEVAEEAIIKDLEGTKQ